MTISLNVTKGETISLKEKVPTLTKVLVGAGWDMATEGKTIDVDLFAVVLGADGKPLNGEEAVVYFGKKSHASGAIQHGGDNLTGEGQGDDETIVIDLNALPAEATKVRIATTIY